MSSKFRILPLLIFVAMLAFSVRLAGVVTGISHFSGSAFAESAEKKEEPEKEAEAEKKDTAESDKSAEEKTDPKEGAKNEKKEQSNSKEKESKSSDITEAKGSEASTPEWRDAGDSDLDITGVKMELLEELSKRSAKLDEQDKSLKAREALLKATEQEIDRKYQELTKLRTEIEVLLGKQSEEEEKRVASLVKIYEGMKPKDAARIFDTLDLDILVSVVSKMSERKISPILGLMNPERAKTLTIMLAEQKQLPSLGADTPE